jgi:hypothetical protein
MEIVFIRTTMRFRTQTAAYPPGVDDGDYFSAVEISAVRFTGFQRSNTLEKLAVEEPLEIEVGIYASCQLDRGQKLEILVGKDFACLDLSDADDEDIFPNPAMGVVC